MPVARVLTVGLSRADLAAPPWQQHRVRASWLRALRLDAAAANAANDATLLVDLQVNVQPFDIPPMTV